MLYLGYSHCQSSFPRLLSLHPCGSISVIPSRAESSKEQSNFRIDIRFQGSTSRERRQLRELLNQHKILQLNSLGGNDEIIVGAGKINFKDKKSIILVFFAISVVLTLHHCTLSSGVGLRCAKARAKL